MAHSGMFQYATVQQFPDGIVGGFEPMPYEYRRWNGTAWSRPAVDAYNVQLSRVQRYWVAGFDCHLEVESLYRLARTFDSHSLGPVR